MSDVQDQARNQQASRRKAVQQLGGPRSAQMFRDTETGEVVVLRQKDGWGTISKRPYFERTWVVEEPIDYVRDSGLSKETISQETKVERMSNGRYENVEYREVREAIDSVTRGTRRDA